MENPQTTKVTDYHDFTTKRMSVAKRRALDVGDWWLNRIKCDRCGDILTSRNRYDFKWCECKGVAVDGGSWYLKRVTNDCSFTEMSEKFTYQPKNDE